jgi:hypothetical protein
MEAEKKKNRSQQNQERQAKVNLFEELEEAAGNFYITQNLKRPEYLVL